LGDKYIYSYNNDIFYYYIDKNSFKKLSYYKKSGRLFLKYDEKNIFFSCIPQAYLMKKKCYIYTLV